MQPEYRDSMQLTPRGVDLLAGYYSRKCLANIEAPKCEDESLVTLEDLPKMAKEVFSEALQEDGNFRCAFLFEDGPHCIPVIYIKEIESGLQFEAILVADSRGGHEGDAAQVLSEQFAHIEAVYRVDAPRRSDKTRSDDALSWWEGVRFAAIITGQRGNDYILPNMMQELRNRSKPSTVPRSGRVMAVTLPFELAKLSQLNDFFAAQLEAVADENPQRASEKRQQFTDFDKDHRVTVQMKDGNGGSTQVERIDWLRKESFKSPELMEIEFYNQQLTSISIHWTAECQNLFMQEMKAVKRNAVQTTPPPVK